MKLLKDKAKKKSSQSSSQSMFSLSPLFKYAVFGGGGISFFSFNSNCCGCYNVYACFFGTRVFW